MAYFLKTFLVLASLAVCYGTPKSQWCHADKRTKACESGYQLKGPYKKDFEEACHRHDLCYRCGVKYGWTRDSCDTTFKNNIHKVCRTLYRRKTKRSIYDIALKVSKAIAETHRKIKQGHDAVVRAAKRLACSMGAGVYYTTIRAYAKDEYASEADTWCSDQCVLEEGDPNSVKTLMK